MAKERKKTPDKELSITERKKRLQEIRANRIEEETAIKEILHKPLYTDGHELAFYITQYVVGQHINEEPLTAAGCAIACGTTRCTLGNYRTGEKDYWCTDVTDKYRNKLDSEEALFIYDYLIGGSHKGKKTVWLSTVLDNCEEIFSAERERRLYKRGSVADIFAMKAQDGWQDDGGKSTTNNTLVITGGESAEAALKMLGYTKGGE